MPELRHSEKTNLDDQLANFTDRLLDSESPQALDELHTENNNLRQLAETVVMLKQTLQACQPDQATANKIHSVLMAEWHQTRLDTHVDKNSESIWQRLSNFFRHSFRGQPAFSLSVITLVMVALLTVWFLFPTGESLPGAATHANKIPVIILAGLVIVLVAVWTWRKRK